MHTARERTLFSTGSLTFVDVPERSLMFFGAWYEYHAFLAGSAAHKNTGGLLGAEWSRVILDEAHSIRNTNTEQVTT